MSSFSLDPETRREHAAKMVLTGIFFAIFGIFISGNTLRRRGSPEYRLSLLDLILMGLSVFRMGRLIAYDRVSEPFRRPFTETVPDDTGAGDTVVARGVGARQAIGQLISCPICAGTWVAAALAYGMQVFPGPTRLFNTIMGMAGLVEILNALVEALQWIGQLARAATGVSAAQSAGRAGEGGKRPSVGQD